MKILFAASEYIEPGKPMTGFPAYLYRVTKSLEQLGHFPVIVTCGKKEFHKFDGRIEIWSVAVAYQNTFSPCWNVIENSLRSSWAVNRKIKEITSKEQVDIIQFTSINSLALFYTGRVPAVLRLSSYAGTYFASYSTFSPRTVKAMAFLERTASKRCNVIFAPCRKTAEAFEKVTGRRVFTIETPFLDDAGRYDKSFWEENLKQKKYVLFFGTLYAEKGILVIAEILEKFLIKNPEYYFVFAGDSQIVQGRDARKIICEAAGGYRERVVLTGALPHQKLYPIIQHADFVVLPSLMDNLPNTCIEAMYFGRIVLGTDGASFEQLIVNGRNGFLCKIGDSEDLLEKMQAITELGQKDKQKIEDSARKTIERLKPENIVKKLLRLYQCILERRKK